MCREKLHAQLNRDFVIRHYPPASPRQIGYKVRPDKLVTARQADRIVSSFGDPDLFLRIAERVQGKGTQKEIVKLRRGDRFVFISR